VTNVIYEAALVENKEITQVTGVIWSTLVPITSNCFVLKVGSKMCVQWFWKLALLKMCLFIKALRSWQNTYLELKQIEFMDGSWMSGVELGRI
jgi:hypothetical protein